MRIPFANPRSDASERSGTKAITPLFRNNLQFLPNAKAHTLAHFFRDDDLKFGRIFRSSHGSSDRSRIVEPPPRIIPPMHRPPFRHPSFASDAYDELSFWSSRFGALLFDHLELRRGIVGLDVACGAGFPLFELAHVHGPSSRFVGIDIWNEALERAAKKVEVYGLTNVELREADASALPFDDGSFDLITSNLGINNFADPPAVLRECFRVARPGARIALTTNLTGHMAGFYEIYRDTLRQLGRHDLLPALDTQEAHRGTRADVERMLVEAGFTLTNIIEDRFDLRFADGTAMLRHSLVQFFLGGWRGVTEDLEVWDALERNLNAASPLRFGIPMLYAEGVRPTWRG